MRFSKVLVGSLVLGSLAVSGFSKTGVDALVIYSDGANKLYNGDAKTRIEHLIATTNKIYKDSGLDIELDAVKIMPYNLDDSKKSSEVLSQIQKDKKIRQIRDEVGADEVIIYRPYAHDGVCGIAYQNNILGDSENAHYAKNATVAHVTIDCGGYVTAHEVGHNMGLGHSPKQGSSGAFSYARGYGVDGDFVTVMAYSSAYNAKKVYKFSSPNLKCNGVACGVAEGLDGEADAVKALKKTVPLLAEFREHKDVNSDNSSSINGGNDKDKLDSAKKLYEQKLKEYKEVRKKLYALYGEYKSSRKTFYAKYQKYKKLVGNYRDGKVSYSTLKNFYYNSLIPSYRGYIKSYRSFAGYYYGEYKDAKKALLDAKKSYNKTKKAYK